MNGLVNPQGNDSKIVAVCPTGNCTFTSDNQGVTHSSVGMCSDCIDCSSLLKYGPDVTGRNVYSLATGGIDGNISVGLGPDIHLNLARPSSLTWASSVWTDSMKKVMQYALFNVTILASSAGETGVIGPYKHRKRENSTDEGSGGFAVAATCSLYPCVKHYYGNVANGVLAEKIVSTEALSIQSINQFFNSKDYFVGNYTALKKSCSLDGNVYTPANMSSVPAKPNRQFTSCYNAAPSTPRR